jgi:hypothetical protein
MGNELAEYPSLFLHELFPFLTLNVNRGPELRSRHRSTVEVENPMSLLSCADSEANFAEIWLGRPP